MPDSVVECFTGLMGGGKSYMAVERASKHFLKAGRVFTNLQLKFDNIKTWAEEEHGILLQDQQYSHLSLDELREFPRHITAGTQKNPCLVIIDEAALFFNARDWAKTSKAILEFLTQTRKVDVNIIFITQSIDDIDKQFRRRIHYTWTMVDVQKIKVFNLRWPWPHMIRTCYHGISFKAKLRRLWVLKNVKIFDFYSSKQQFTDLHLKESGEIELEKTEQPVASMKRPLISTKSMLILCATLLGGWYLFGKDESTKTVQHQSSPVTYTVREKDEKEKKPALVREEKKLYVTSLQVNGDEYYIKFSNDTFLTHLSGVELKYFHHFIVLDGVPFEIDTNYQAPARI